MQDLRWCRISAINSTLMIDLKSEKYRRVYVKSLCEHISFDDLGQHLTSNPCHLSCWSNLIYHLNDLPAQFGRVTSNANHFSFQKIHMILMPFQTWLLDLKFENDRVTCFGNRIVMTCCSFQPGSWPIHAKYIKIPQSLVITNFNRMNASGSQRCIALPFVISRMSLSHGRVLILPLPFFTPTPLMTPSSPNRRNTKPWPLLDRFCFHPKTGLSGWSSLWGLQPEPGSRHMT